MTFDAEEMCLRSSLPTKGFRLAAPLLDRECEATIFQSAVDLMAKFVVRADVILSTYSQEECSQRENCAHVQGEKSGSFPDLGNMCTRTLRIR